MKFWMCASAHNMKVGMFFLFKPGSKSISTWMQNGVARIGKVGRVEDPREIILHLCKHCLPINIDKHEKGLRIN